MNPTTRLIIKTFNRLYAHPFKQLGVEGGDLSRKDAEHETAKRLGLSHERVYAAAQWGLDDEGWWRRF